MGNVGGTSTLRRFHLNLGLGIFRSAQAKRKVTPKKTKGNSIFAKVSSKVTQVNSKGTRAKNTIGSDSEIGGSDSGISCTNVPSHGITEESMFKMKLGLGSKKGGKQLPSKVKVNKKQKNVTAGLGSKQKNTKDYFALSNERYLSDIDTKDAVNVGPEKNNMSDAHAFHNGALLGTVSSEFPANFLIPEHAIKKEILDGDEIKIKEEIQEIKPDIDNFEDIKPFQGDGNTVRPKRFPRKACPMTFKLKVIDYYKNIQNFYKTARHFGLCRTNVQRWVKKEAVIREMASLYGNNKQRMFGGGRKITSQRIEMELITWYCWHSENGIPLTYADLVEEAVALHKDHGNPAFVGSNGWATKFKARHSLDLVDSR